MPLHCATFAGPFAGPLASASAATCSPCPLGGKHVRVFPQDRHVVPLSPITYNIIPKYDTIWGTIFRVHSLQLLVLFEFYCNFSYISVKAAIPLEFGVFAETT